MADEVIVESKAKKPGLLRRIVWGIWIILLTALLVLGFVFAAPWKVITLIAIFLAAATILPRIYRKWFWLAVGLVVLSLIVWIFLPDDNKDWKPYQFDKEFAQLQARHAVPDSENAALVYNQILADWKQKDTNEPNLSCDNSDFIRHNFWLTKDQPEIAAYIQYHQDIIEAVLYATKIEKCSFPIVANIFDFDKEMERLRAARQWAYLLVASGNNDIAEGKTNDALEKYFAVIRMGQHLSRQPSSLDMMVGIAIESSSLGSINNFVVSLDANEPYLNKVEQVVSSIKHDFISDLQGFIDSEKLMFKNMMGGLFYEVNSKGNVRLNRDPTAIIREQTRKRLSDDTIDIPEFFSSYWFKKLMKAEAILFWFYAPSTPEKLSKIIDGCFKTNYEMTKPDFDWSKEPEMPPEYRFKININQLVELIAKSNKGTYFGLHNIYLRIAAQQRGTLLIIALRRYKNANGRWPEKLEDMKDYAPDEIFIDPVNGDSFVYKLNEDNFTLYSKGKNGIDDDGKQEDFAYPDRNKAINKGCDDWMIWPRGSKVPKQEQKTNKEKE